MEGDNLDSQVYRAQIILRSDSLLYRTLFSSQQLRRESITSGRTFTYHGLTIMRLAHASEERKETTLTLYFQPDQQFYRWFDPVPDINGIDALEGN